MTSWEVVYSHTFICKESNGLILSIYSLEAKHASSRLTENMIKIF